MMVEKTVAWRAATMAGQKAHKRVALTVAKKVALMVEKMGDSKVVCSAVWRGSRKVET